MSYHSLNNVRTRLKNSLVIKRSIFALVICGLIISLLPTLPVSAASPATYTWATPGNAASAISVKAANGKKGDGLLYPTRADPNGTYSGAYHSTNPTFFGLGEEDCDSLLTIKLTGDNTGTVIANTEPRQSDNPFCKGMPGIGATIQIGGARPAVAETDAQRRITVRVFGDPQDKEITVVIKGSQPGDIGEYPATQQGDGYYTTEPLFTDPDTFTIYCKDTGLPFDCGVVTVTKQKYLPLTVDLGQSPKSKELTFRLFIDCMEVHEDPPYTLSIYNNKNKLVATIPGDVDVGAGGLGDAYPPGVFDTGCLRFGGAGPIALEPGKYTGCIVGKDFCDNFTKVFGKNERINLLFGFGGIPKDDVVCIAGMLGWLLCPVADITKNISQTMAKIVEGLLYVEPLTLNTTGANPIYVIWSIIRDIANIAFVILFLIIIFSQATSLGMSNYGIKRLLPRLLIMAILVNISYFVCAFAIDVANLLGAGVKGLIEVGIKAAPLPDLGKQEWNGSYAGFYVAIFAAIIGLALLGPLWALLAAVFSAVAFAVLIGFVVLVVRQVLIILLVLVSPLAFAAALLPNTENWFNRWRKTFTTLLLSYPIMMFVFYGSALVAAVVGAALMPVAK
jgi:hypothetical protein